MPDLTPGVPSALSPLVRRIVAPNPGPFTGPGTNTYLVGIDEVAVIDPGPDDQSHIDAIVGRVDAGAGALGGADPHASRPLARHRAAGGGHRAPRCSRTASASTRTPNVVPDRVIGEGDTIEGTEFGLEVLHTPGHAPNHLCFLLEEERVLFTGDNVLEGMFSVINPQRGGDMTRVPRHARAHREAPRRRGCAPATATSSKSRAPRIQEYSAHRIERERQVLGVLKAGPARIVDIVTTLYGDQELHPKLVEAAGWQVHAHLLKLKAEARSTGTSVKSAWKLA